MITEQIRTLPATRLTGAKPLGKLNGDHVAQVRSVLAKMIDV
ncbi:MAG TPA: hypothetical protein VJX10_09415 [Pseudonocardiaceae bacterium]|nr:hypothetical protein [Pseudonocardiaceae bacterium]